MVSRFPSKQIGCPVTVASYSVLAVLLHICSAIFLVGTAMTIRMMMDQPVSVLKGKPIPAMLLRTNCPWLQAEN